jgi:hypothetical protein
VQRSGLANDLTMLLLLSVGQGWEIVSRRPDVSFLKAWLSARRLIIPMHYSCRFCIMLPVLSVIFSSYFHLNWHRYHLMRTPSALVHPDRCHASESVRLVQQYLQRLVRRVS